jgi:hypothetical protein
MRLCIRACQHGTYAYASDECVCDDGFDGILCETSRDATNMGVISETPAAASTPKKAVAMTVGVISIAGSGVVLLVVVALVFL